MTTKTNNKTLASITRFPRNSALLKIVREHEEYEARKRLKFQKIKQAVRMIDETKLPADYRFSVDNYGITIYVPWSKENMGATRKACGEGWKFQSQYKDDSGTLTRHYIFDGDYDVQLSIILDSQKLVEGACRRILVEEKHEPVTYTRKVYKVICDDGTETIEVDSETPSSF